MSRSAREQARALTSTEIAFFALTLAAAIGFRRVFTDWSFLPPMVLAAAGSHLLAAACRRRGWNVLIAGLLSLGALSLLVTLAFYRSTSWYGLPTLTTWDAMVADLEVSWDQFGTAVAPVVPETGFVVSGVLAIWVAAFLADSFAFRALASIEAILPSGILFVFASALGADEYRFIATALWLAAALIAFALHRTMAQEGGGWLAGIRRGTVGAVLRTSAILGLIVVVLAMVVGPALPGAGEEPLIDTKRGLEGTRQTVSPLVDIQGRIVDRSDLEAFTVQSDARSYWRLTALDDFDGRLWTSERGYGDAGGDLGGGLPEEFTVPVNQQFTILALDSIWLPAAYTPSRIDTEEEVRYDDDTASLVTRRNEVRPGTVYSVVSRVPDLDPATLEQSTAPPPSNVTDHYLALPADFPANLRTIAAQITATGATPYQKSKQLQDFFQINFVYDLTVTRGHSTGAIEAFLVSRRGYCEQFAGTFAAFARAVGLPARVAVGFTPGELRADGRYHVLGKHMHAWPEVYFTGLGWVPFEPTPSRGIPGAQGYTGVPVAQEGEAPQAPVETIPTATSVQTGPTTIPDPDADTGFLDGIDFGSIPEPVQEAGPNWPLRIAIVVGVLLLLAALWLLIAPRIMRARWDKRRRQAATGADLVLVNWREATDGLARVGIPSQPSETPLEYADRLQDAKTLDADLVKRMADHVTVAAYGRDDVPEDIVEATDTTRRQLEERRWARASWRERLQWLADPRPVVRRQLPGDDIVPREKIDA